MLPRKTGGTWVPTSYLRHWQAYPLHSIARLREPTEFHFFWSLTVSDHNLSCSTNQGPMCLINAICRNVLTLKHTLQTAGGALSPRWVWMPRAAILSCPFYRCHINP